MIKPNNRAPGAKENKPTVLSPDGNAPLLEPLCGSGSKGSEGSKGSKGSEGCGGGGRRRL